MLFDKIRQMAVVIDTEGPAASVTFGDDVVSVTTETDGTVDDIKLELELLSAVGEVGETILISRQRCCQLDQDMGGIVFSRGMVLVFECISVM